MNTTYRPLLFILLAILLTGCSKKTDDEVLLILKEIEQAGADRGVDISDEINNIEVIFDDLEGLKLASTTQSGNTIRVDSTAWRYLSRRGKFMLLAHEVGHAFLKRQHLDETLYLGECKSIMSSADAECRSNIYTNMWYKYYLDELFDQSTNSPNWYQSADNRSMNDVFLLLNDTIRNSFFADTIMLDSSKNFEISLGWSSIGRRYHPLVTLNGVSFDIVRNRFRITGGNLSSNFLDPEIYSAKIELGSGRRDLILRRQGKFLYIFYNARLVHIMDYDRRNIFNFKSKNLDFNQILTSFFDEPATIEIRSFD